MKSVLNRRVAASMMLAGILVFTGTAAATPGQQSVGNFSTTEPSAETAELDPTGTVWGSSQKVPLEMSPQNKIDCWEGKLCFWTGPFARGSLFMYPYYGKGVCHNLYTSLNNNASSSWNRAFKTVRFYRDYDCSGDSIENKHGRYRYEMPSGFDNTISSFKFTS